MKVIMRFLVPRLREKLGYELEVVLDAPRATFKDLLDMLDEEYGGVKEAILDQGGWNLKKGILAMVNGVDIKHLGGLKAELKDGDKVLIFPPLGGG